ncbi:MAG TPA: tetratricopeptide repeat protein, partial [Casimicrobiaceae bacterium]|nr:tetratricopeptide repeat protein [Casimicrobiaceae bacterium]
MAWIDLRSGRLDSAEQFARDAIALDHANWQADFALGAALRAKGDFDAAERCYKEALNCSPGNLDCLLDLAAAAIGAKRFDLAETYARQAVSEHPNAETARAALGAALIWQDRFGEANEAFGPLSSTDPGKAPPDAGIPLRDGGRVEEAIEFYRRVLPRNPDLNAHMHYAYSLLKAGHLREGFEQNEFR